MDIGERVRELREKKGITVTELAKRSGLARNSLSLIELGRRDPGAATIKKLARGLAVDPGQLFDEGMDELPRNLTAKFKLTEDGWWIVSVEEIPAVHTQGKTFEEACVMLANAVELTLKYMSNNQ